MHHSVLLIVALVLAFAQGLVACSDDVAATYDTGVEADARADAPASDTTNDSQPLPDVATDIIVGNDAAGDGPASADALPADSASPDAGIPLYPLKADTTCTFGTGADCNPTIDNVIARLDKISGKENYGSWPYGLSGQIDGIDNHWQGITATHYSSYSKYIWLSRSRMKTYQTFNYFDTTTLISGGGSCKPGYRKLAYEKGTEPSYYDSLHPAQQNHGGSGQAIGKYLLFTHNYKSDPANTSYAMILDLTKKWAVDKKAPLKVHDFKLTTKLPSGATWSCNQWIGNAGIIKLASGHFLIVDTCSNGKDFQGFQLYLSKQKTIDSGYTHQWTIQAPWKGKDYQQVSVIGQSDGQIFLILAGKSNLEAYKLTVTSASSAKVTYINTLSNNEYASTFTPGTSDFRSGGGVVVWKDAQKKLRLMVLATQMGSILYSCDKYARWLDTY